MSAVLYTTDFTFTRTMWRWAMWTCGQCGTENPRSEFFCKGKGCGAITTAPVHEEATCAERLELLREYFIRVAAEDPHHQKTNFDATVLHALNQLWIRWSEV